MNDGEILFDFSDRVSAFDIQMATPIPRKGEVLCKFAEFWFNSVGTANHMISLLSKNQMVVKRLTMIPIECIVRGYFYGSLVDRFEAGADVGLPSDYHPILAGELPEPIFDPTTKSEHHDSPIDRDTLVSKGMLSEQEFDLLSESSISLYKKMKTMAHDGGFIMADVKFEFGRDKDGQILLGDSLGPDEFRLWMLEKYNPGTKQDSFDKQLLRDWLTRSGFKTEVDRLAREGKKPASPTLPDLLVSELLSRYITAYEKICKKSL